MKSDLEIAREIKLKPIQDIAQHIGIEQDKLIPYGHHKAKVPLELIQPNQLDQSKLILVTAISPTKSGIGKTTTSVSLGLGLEKIGKKATLALREPSLGPCFGMKGGAAGGGYAQVLPMEDINLHFTGDFHAITSAHNMLSALLDNHQHQHKFSEQALKKILWKRVLDVNDRALRQIVSGLGGLGNGVPTESGFDITAASELMAVLCLANSMEDLRRRIDQITLGERPDKSPFRVKDLGVGGALTVLLKDAILPNLVQTTENTAAFIHGGPFANIAHGCNSILASQMAMSYGDYAITEAGFGADLGAEKFFNIKCRMGGLKPAATVLVATSQALKLHGHLPYAEITRPNLEALKAGLANLERHLENMKAFGQSVVVAFNQYSFDTVQEMEYIRDYCRERGVAFTLNRGFMEGGKGSRDMAETLVETVQNRSIPEVQYTYELSDAIEDKISKVVQKVYRGKEINFSGQALNALKKIKAQGGDQLPICMAKTQYSFSDDPKLIGAPEDFTFNIEDVILNSGAGFVVVIAGKMMRMPGLPKVPAANGMDWVDGKIVGLS